MHVVKVLAYSTQQDTTAQHTTPHHTTAQSLSPTAATHSTPHALDTPAEAPLQGMLHTRTHLGPVCAHAAGNWQRVSDAVEGVGQPWGWSLCDTPMTQALPRVSIPATLFTPRGGGERCLMAHQPTRTAGVDLRKCVAPLCTYPQEHQTKVQCTTSHKTQLCPGLHMHMVKMQQCGRGSWLRL